MDKSTLVYRQVNLGMPLAEMDIKACSSGTTSLFTGAVFQGKEDSGRSAHDAKVTEG